jgi:PHP family Zn ribbon phosphoesterase
VSDSDDVLLQTTTVRCDTCHNRFSAALAQSVEQNLLCTRCAAELVTAVGDRLMEMAGEPELPLAA